MKRAMIAILSILIIFLFVISLTGCKDKVIPAEEVAQTTSPSKTTAVTEPTEPSEPAQPDQPAVSSDGVEKIKLTTEDGVELSANYFPNEKATKGIILLHMLGRTKEDWTAFAKRLDARYAVIAIDLRGHGESELNWQNFDNRDFSKMTNDVDAARFFLMDEGVDELIIGGASIGANLALLHASQDTTIKAVFALSPSFDYRGIKAINAAQNLGNRPLLVIYSKDDDQSAEDAENIYNAAPAPMGNKEISLDGSAHGTNMLDMALQDKILIWLSEVDLLKK